METVSEVLSTGIPAEGMSLKEFRKLSEFIHSRCGIKMPESKKTMLESRLGKRMRSLNMKSYEEYSDYLFSTSGMENELIHMIDVVTTNKTDFYREPAHFDYLVREAVPELTRNHGAGSTRPLMIWSAGCSTGEEPYTLAMALEEYAGKCPGLKFQYLILATDICTKALDTAKMAVYDDDKTAPLPTNLKSKYLMKSRDRSRRLTRVIPRLRQRVKFRRLNFMDGDFGMREPMDIIFCRNVLIYFDSATQVKLLGRFCQHLIPGGYIFIGHSESLSNMNMPLISAAPAIYRKIHGQN